MTQMPADITPVIQALAIKYVVQVCYQRLDGTVDLLRTSHLGQFLNDTVRHDLYATADFLQRAAMLALQALY